MEEKLEDIASVRAITPEDHAFILTSWLKSYKNSSYFARYIKKPIFYYWHEKIIKRILTHADTRICSLKEDPSVILGYLTKEASEETPIIHYFFTKPSFRHYGVAKMLLQDAQITFQKKTLFTHWTYAMDPFVKKHDLLEYDPYRT